MIPKKDWKVTDQYGNIECPVCRKRQSPNWGQYCVHCCAHNILSMEYVSGDNGAQEIEYTCQICKRTFFDKDAIVENYCLIRKKVQL